jgi:hypothetical protein
MDRADPMSPVPPGPSASEPAAPGPTVPGWTRAATKLLVVGFLIREAFSFWTGHPYDFEVWIRTGHAVASGQNPYALWPPIPGVSISYYNQSLPSAAYPPFFPLLLGGLYRLWEAVGGGNRFVLYFLLKQPQIAGDAAVAFLLHRVTARWTGRASTAMAALGFWSLFPYAILLSAVWGQFDSLVVALVLLVCLAASGFERNVLYGLGIFVKWITAIFLPLEAFAARGGRRAYVLVAAAVPLLATLAVFAAFGWGFTNVVAATVSQSRGGGGGMSWVGIVTSFLLNPTLSRVPYLDLALSYVWVPAVLAAGWVGARWFRTGEPEGILRALLLVTTVFLLTRWGLYEQYLLYLFALLAVDLFVFHPGRKELARLVTILAWVFLLFNNDFLIRFLSPLSPAVTTFTQSLDRNPVFGTVRGYALLVLCALVTVTLVQVAWTFLHDDPAPVPWLYFRKAPASRPDPGGA